MLGISSEGINDSVWIAKGFENNRRVNKPKAIRQERWQVIGILSGRSCVEEGFCLWVARWLYWIDDQKIFEWIQVRSWQVFAALIDSKRKLLQANLMAKCWYGARQFLGLKIRQWPHWGGKIVSFWGDQVIIWIGLNPKKDAIALRFNAIISKFWNDSLSSETKEI